MRVQLSVLIALLGCIFATRPAKAEEPPSITINYLAHSAFVIQTPAGKHLLIDPYADRVWIAYAFPVNVPADVVLISHPHFDHDGGEYQSGRSAWAGKVPVLRWPGRWELDDDTTIYGIKGHHAGIYGREFGQVNTIWRLEIAGLTIVHWGDNGPLTPELAAAIGDVDILMLPADGAYHLITEAQTEAVLKELKPSVVIPMHYYIPELENDSIDDFGPLDQWLRGREGIKCKPGSSWVVSRKTLPANPEILVLKIADSVYEANDTHPPQDVACIN